jgi:hypothetical protein
MHKINIIYIRGNKQYETLWTCRVSTKEQNLDRQIVILLLELIKVVSKLSI